MNAILYYWYKGFAQNLDHINFLKKSSDQASTKGKRNIVLETHDDPLKSYWRLGIPSGKAFFNDKDIMLLWIGRILNALVEKGHLFNAKTSNASEYFIQA